MPEVANQTWVSAEPFDGHMILPRAMYVMAAREGKSAVLDGIDGDLLFSEGRALGRLFRRGQWVNALREARARRAFWGSEYPVRRDLLSGLAQAFVPRTLRRGRRDKGTGASDLEGILAGSFIHPDFAAAVDLAGRLEALAARSEQGPLMDAPAERARAVDHPYLSVGIERYHRVAHAAGIRPLHPFLDVRVVEFILSLPDQQRSADGWPKILLRRAMEGRMPDEVRWRRGKYLLGGTFNRSFFRLQRQEFRLAIEENLALLSKYIRADSLRVALQSALDYDDPTRLPEVQDVAYLACWLRRNGSREAVVGQAENTEAETVSDEG
jgi:asparagine synthase (glutamine-hydrolysing)